MSIECVGAQKTFGHAKKLYESQITLNSSRSSASDLGAVVFSRTGVDAARVNVGTACVSSGATLLNIYGLNEPANIQ